MTGRSGAATGERGGGRAGACTHRAGRRVTAQRACVTKESAKSYGRVKSRLDRTWSGLAAGAGPLTPPLLQNPTPRDDEIRAPQHAPPNTATLPPWSVTAATNDTAQH